MGEYIRLSLIIISVGLVLMGTIIVILQWFADKDMDGEDTTDYPD